VTCKKCNEEPVIPENVEVLPECNVTPSFSNIPEKPIVECEKEVVVTQPDPCA